MRFVLLGLCLVGCPGARSQAVDASPSVSATATSAAPVETSAPVSDGGVDAAAVTLADCFEPSRITQLGTMKNDKVSWDGELVSDGVKRFDPETLGEVPVPARTHRLQALHAPTDLLATGERVEQHGTTLLAGARKLRLGKDMTFDRVENGRWIVLATGDGEPRFHILDGLTGKMDAREYVAVRGDLAAFEGESMTVTVTNRVTHKEVVKDVSVCTAGGAWSWELSPRFLWCTSSRSGAVGTDLRTGTTFDVGQSAFVALDESYLVRVPGIGLPGNVISEDHVEWASAETGRTLTLTKDVEPATDQTPPLTKVPVAFCGEGKLFAIVTRKELVVYRGADARRLSAARAMPGGAIAFSRSGRYLIDARAGAATVYRLEP
ncbi:MAG TPA: hypothetical protein VH054_25850 [Polyangiaceae bacterium]|nr:hypothetical protein [Polyangiaceae bacterium]